MADTQIDGDLHLEEWGASLEADEVRIGGNLQFAKAQAASIQGVSIGGDLQLSENRGALPVSLTRVADNLQMVENRGGATLIDKWIAQSLQCDENEPAPTRSGNEAGEKEGQCAPVVRGPS